MAKRSARSSELTRVDFGMLERNAAGGFVTRDATCQCGKQFTQCIMAAKALESLERQGKVEVVAKQIPGFWLPVHCPTCERIDLAHQARLDESRARDGAPPPTYSPTYPDVRRSA